MARIPLADPPDSTDVPLNLFRVVAHADGAFGPWLRYGGALLTRLELAPVLRELAILQVARLVGSSYEWVQHDPIARAVGVSGAQIAAIEAGRDDDPAFDTEQALVLRITRAAVTDGIAAEADVVELAERLGPRQLVELLLVIGNYVAIAMLVASTGLEPDPPVDAGALLGGGDAT